MATILYVDNIVDDSGKQIGRVINLNKVERILKLIQADMDMITDELTKNNNVQHIQRAGRFLIATYIMLDAAEYKYQMVIADTKSNGIAGRAFIATLNPALMPLAEKLFNELQYLSEEERTNLRWLWEMSRKIKILIPFSGCLEKSRFAF